MLKTIAMDGPDYSGKSTLCRLVNKILRTMGINSTVINHPTQAGLHGKLARLHIVEGKSRDIVSRELCLDFKDTLDNVVPQYDVVILDRYCMSTISYQGDEGKREVFKSGVLNHHYSPKLHVVTDVNYQTALQRAQKRTAEAGQSWDDVVLTSHHLASESNWDALRSRYNFAENILMSSGAIEHRVIVNEQTDINLAAAKIVQMILEN